MPHKSNVVFRHNSAVKSLAWQFGTLFGIILWIFGSNTQLWH